jgi:type IV pilus assembly protein PilY1
LVTGLFLFVCITFVFNQSVADDTCVFLVTPDDVGPNIVFLLDNGAAMEQITWHGDYDSKANYTPNVDVQIDAVSAEVSTGSQETVTTLVLNPFDESDYPFAVSSDVEGVTSGAVANVTNKTYVNGKLYLGIDSITGSFQTGETVQRYKNRNNIATGTLEEITEFVSQSGGGGDMGDLGSPNGFFNDKGYAIISHGGVYYLVKVLDNLLPDEYSNGLAASSGNDWTINGNTVTLPAQPSAAEDEAGIIDNATIFRYSKNYLNWLFFYETAGDIDGDALVEPVYDGTALPDKSRFYYAKQALMTVAKITSNLAYFGIYNFANDEGGSRVQPLGLVVDTVVDGDPMANVLDPNYENNINNMGTVTYSPLAEGLATVGAYYASESSHVVGEYCQKSFVIVVSSGMSSQDQDDANQYVPESLQDHDLDGGDGGIGEGLVRADSTEFTIPVNYNGSTWLDDVAHYLYTNDVVGYQEGHQNVMTCTVGFMGDRESNLFLINTSNNGTGNQNLYDTTHNEYGKYHFTAESPNGLSAAIMAAINAILDRSNTFTAPVVPVTRTTSGSSIYVALFKPTQGIFWEGDVVKFGINEYNQIVDANDNLATWPNGSIKETAVPFWSTKNWSNADYSAQDCTGDGCNYIENTNRNIYTYLGASTDLTQDANAFVTTNGALTAEIFGNPTQGVNTVVNFVRGADALDEDENGDIDENRAIITGDVLHSEPAVFTYLYEDGSSKTMVYFGANDGMLHAVLDTEVVITDGEEVESVYGTEAWAFIPPDQLPRLKGMVEGYVHQIYVDSSARIWFKDVDEDGKVDTDDGDQVILVCGERKGGTSYFALDVTTPTSPSFLWRISQADDSVNGSGPLPAGAAPLVIADLGQSWSEPQFGDVKTTADDVNAGTPVSVFFIAGGFSSDNSAGKAIMAINVLDGSVVKAFKNDGTNITEMDYSMPSTVSLIDANSNGFVDKVYVGDLGGQMWRLGRFTDSEGDPLLFPACDENINNWQAQVLFKGCGEADCTNSVDDDSDGSVDEGGLFFYPPSITLEIGYDLVFSGTGDREDACTDVSADRVYCVKDTHGASALQESALVDVTDPEATLPNLAYDQGWYLKLGAGEKILSEGTVFYKTYYVTTFTPNDDPCLPGGLGKLYALGYKTGAAVLPVGGSPTRSFDVGGGIPSKPVMIITTKGQKLLISIGSTMPDADSEQVGAGVVITDPVSPPMNFFYISWKEW